MGQHDHREFDLARDQLIQDYLENEAPPAAEERFRLLLGEESFRRRVAQFAIDFGHLNDLTQQGMLAGARTDGGRRGRRVAVAAATAVAILIALGVAWFYTPKYLREPTGSSPLAQTTPLSQIAPTKIHGRPQVIAQVEHVVGRVVRAASLDAVDGDIVTAKIKIRSGEVLRTVGDDSFAVLQFVDDTVFAIAGNSELKCTVDGVQKRVVVTEGDLIAQVMRQPEEEPLIIETPHAEAEVLGTKLSLIADSDMTELAVQEGDVRMHRLTDGRTIDVRSGQTAFVSAESDFVPQSLPVSNAWDEDFSDGLPRRWRAGRLVHESLPSGSFDAVRAVQRRGMQGDPGGPFRIATTREWARGLFRVEQGTHLNFTYKLRFRGGFHIRVSTNTDPLDPRTIRIYEYRSRSLRERSLTRWRTVSVPLQYFRKIQRNSTASTFGAPVETGERVIMVGFGSPGRDPGLVLDRIWATQGPPKLAVVLGESD